MRKKVKRAFLPTSTIISSRVK